MDSKMADSWRSEISLVIYNALEEMYRSQRHTDCEVIVNEVSYKCHRAVLAAVSPYFDAMFSSGMIESLNGIVHLQGVSPQIFEKILSFIYSGQKVVAIENADELLKAAAMLQIKELHKKCENFLLGKITSENCIGAWKLSKSHDCPALSKASWSLIMECFEDISRSDDFMYLDADDLISIITNDNLKVSNEEVVCDAVFRWYGSDPTLRKQQTIDMFQYLRLPLLSSEYLLHEVEPLDIVVENSRCREIVREAISYQMLPARRSDFNSPRVAFRTHSSMEEILIVLGGYNAIGEKVVDMLAYSFNKHKWFFLTPLPLLLGREFASCVFGNDIFVSGGSQKLDCLLRSENNDWYRCTALQQGRRRHAMVAVGDSIYVLGGYDDNIKEETSKTLSTVDEYNINSRTWKKIGDLPIPVRSMASAVAKEKIYIYGGILFNERETDDIQYFDSRLQTSGVISKMPNLCKLSKAVTSEKRVFIICTDGSIVEMLDDGKCETVQVISSFTRRRFGAVHHRGNVLIIGGETGNSIHNNILSFNPITKEIQGLKSSLPSRANFGGLKIVIQKKYLTREWKSEG
ncbi:hypothetical protein KUTeg_001188 [Tegillarca granosa]|uniref:BTB domain-containing protein n=1 Tax=Tegillarca granosa TaxID=220873 RepID=A0ABQ9G044_TEGGR|nr:hypothetical protein KUTeg_001188 [Tegillarca granosa]